MDLGAPILDAQASVASASDTSSATASKSVVKIISGGVVSAPGYDPIVLTNSATSQDTQESVFIPDIPIMQVNSTTVNSVEEVVDSTNIITQINKFEATEIVHVDDKDITIIQGSGSTAIVIVVIAVCALFLLLLVLFARFLYNRMRAEKAHAE